MAASPVPLRAAALRRSSSVPLAALLLAAQLLAPAVLGAQEPRFDVPADPSIVPAERVNVILNEGRPLITQGDSFTVSGLTDAPPGSRVLITIGRSFAATEVDDDGRFEIDWPADLDNGTYRVEATVTRIDGVSGSARQDLLVQREGRLPRRPLITPPVSYDDPEAPASEDLQEHTDRWRVVPPPYEIHAKPSRWDPYNQNKLKGDFPIKDNDKFLVLTGTSDTLIDLFSIPTPSGVSAVRPGSIRFFGEDRLFLTNENVFLSADYFKGDTAFKPIEWRVRGTFVGNFNYLDARENAVVKPDVREGTTRADGRFSVQELFGELKLADLSPNYDFVSVRAGVQPFNSDFRGFVFNDMNLGVRLFGSLHSNRTQFNAAVFERLEKDTNSGLNTFELRDQLVAIVNLYRQDFIRKGFTAQASVHYVKDDPTFVFDRNGFLVRPDPFGAFTPHEIEVTYLGVAGFGHFARYNIDTAVYYVVGDDSLNPLAGQAIDVEAMMAAFEISYDHNWWRPKLALFYASGDNDPTDGDGHGFSAIFENPQFAGGGFSFWNRLGIRLTGTGVGLVQRGSLTPDLKSSRDEGQPNFNNPGVQLLSLGVDVELTPEIKGVATANYLRFDHTEPLELALFQAPIDNEIGVDLSVGVRWRPFLNQNVIVVGGVAALLPGSGFVDIYEDGSVLLAGFTNLILTF